MDNRTIAIGIQDFETIIEKDCFYIDKTHFIREWWESNDNTTLITRPRRFGKTLNMNMIERFFSVEYAGKGEIFEGLSIWSDEKYRQLQGTYPVISMSFAKIKECDYANTRAKICQLIVELYRKFSFVRTSGVLQESDLIFWDSVTVEMNDVVATSAVNQLSMFLQQYYGKKVIILLDEYDTPMQEAYVNGYWDELAAFTRSLFNATFKTNPYMERAIMTGITRVSKESIFSDLNHLKVITTTSNEYATAFGFTEKEVFAALEEYSYSSAKEEVKAWYNGFTFGEHTDIYNPWSILNFLDTGKFDTYWSNTSSNSLINKLLQKASKQIKMSFEELLKGNTVQYAIDEQIIYNQLDTKNNAIWSLLLASGYLKVVNCEKRISYSEKPRYTLALTNGEVISMFYDMVLDWFSKEDSYNEFVSAMLKHNVKEMNYYMNEVALQTFSYFDTGNSMSLSAPERFYHGFVLGLLVELRKDYVVQSNRESGLGRYDVILEPKDKEKDAYILEFKAIDVEEETNLQDTAQAALKQIKEKQYAVQLQMKGYISIHFYGFAFQGKKVFIIKG